MAKIFLLFFLNQLSCVKSDIQDSYKYWYVDLEGFLGYRFSDKISVGILGGISLYLDPISTSDLTSKAYLSGMYFSSEIYDNFLISNVWIQLNYGYNKYYNHFNCLILFKPGFYELPFSIGISLNNNSCKNEAFSNKKSSVSIVLCADISKNTRKLNFGAKVYGSIIGSRSLTRSAYYDCVNKTLQDSYDSLEKIAEDTDDCRQDCAKEMMVYLDHAKNIFISKQVISSLKNREFLDNLCDWPIQKRVVLSIRKPEVLSIELAQYRSKLPLDDNILGKNIMMLQDYLWYKHLPYVAESFFNFETQYKFIDIYSGLFDVIPFIDISGHSYQGLFSIFNYIKGSLMLLLHGKFVDKVMSEYCSIIADKMVDGDMKSECYWPNLRLGDYIKRMKKSEIIKNKFVNKNFKSLITIYNGFPTIEKFIKERESKIDELIKIIDDMYYIANMDLSLLFNKNLPIIVSEFDDIFGELSEKEYNIMKKIDTVSYEQESYFLNY